MPIRPTSQDIESCQLPTHLCTFIICLGFSTHLLHRLSPLFGHIKPPLWYMVILSAKFWFDVTNTSLVTGLALTHMFSVLCFLRQCYFAISCLFLFSDYYPCTSWESNWLGVSCLNLNTPLLNCWNIENVLPINWSGRMLAMFVTLRRQFLGTNY